MNCRHARTEIPLLAGGDLTDAARVAELRRHVSGCTECRRHYRGVKASLATLAGSDRAATWTQSASVWPAVHQAIVAPAPTPGAAAWENVRKLRPWTPFVAMTAACLLMMVALGHRQPETDAPGVNSRAMVLQPGAEAPPQNEPPERTHSESEAVEQQGRLQSF